MRGNGEPYFEAQHVLFNRWAERMAHITLTGIGAPQDGGIGSVSIFEAEGLPEGYPHRFALKRIKQDPNGVLDLKTRKQMIEREFKATLSARSALDSNVRGVFPEVYGYGLYSDRYLGIHEEPAFIMQDLSGYQTLYSWMNRRGNLLNSVRFTQVPTTDVARFGLRLLEGLEAIWTECDLVHGDLSCSNIMINVGAETIADVVDSDAGFYVIDFGQAKRGFRTVTQVRAGTAPFSPLEIDCREGLDVTGTDVRNGIGQYYELRNQPTVDLWSVGALLAFIRTGALPPGPDGCVLDCHPCDSRGCEKYQFRFCDERKKYGIIVPPRDDSTSEQERALCDAIAVCTRFNPQERELDKVKALLSEAAAEVNPQRTAPSVDRVSSDTRQNRVESALGPSHTPPFIIPVQDEPEPATHTVFAQAYKMYTETGEEYSEYDSDVLVIGATEESCIAQRRKLHGKRYSLKRAGDLVNLSDGGGGLLRKTDADRMRIPWKNIEVAFVRTKIYPNSMFSWFYECSRLEAVVGIERIRTQFVTDMAGLFCGCSSLCNLDLSGFDTSNVTDMSLMFAKCTSLASLDLSGFDTSNVTDMTLMFAKCTSLASLDLSGFDTSSVTDMTYMFANCTSLTNLDLLGFDTSEVVRMNHMFANCHKLKRLGYSPTFRLCDGATVENVFEGSALEPFVSLSERHALGLPINMRINPSDDWDFSLDRNNLEKMMLIEADGSSREAQVVLCFKLEKYDDQEYVIYSFGEVDDEGNETLHCSRLNWDNDKPVLNKIPQDEWEDVWEVMQRVIEYEED